MHIGNYTQQGLLWIQHHLLISFEKKQCVFMVMLELSPAFDMVNHQKFLDRLTYLHMASEGMHEWIKFYLTRRRQFVTIKGEQSD